LCRQKANLLKSHLIPRAIYKRIRRSNGADNRIVLVSGGVAAFTDKQVQDYLLCGACEDRLGRVENWVVSNCLQEDGSFPFRDAVFAVPRHPETDDVALGAYLKGAELETLAYFAASMLWRAAVHRWGQFGSDVTVDLGPYEEKFRQYLLGKTGFPPETVLGIFVAGKANYQDQFATAPVPLDVKGYHQYTFAIPGIKFSILVGKTLPGNVRAGCSLRSIEGYIYIDDHLDRHELKFLMGRAQISGKLLEQAKLYKKTHGLSGNEASLN